MEFQEKYKVDIALFDSTGSTTEQVSDYFDMRDYRRADFVLQSKVVPAFASATGVQLFTLRLLQSSNSTGGGSTAISSATAVCGKNGTASITTASKMREAWIRFSTINSDSAVHIVINSASYISATSGSAAHYFACGASDNATVASEGFVAMFNSTVLNTATSITEKWAAATDAGGAYVRIYPKTKDATDFISIATTGSSKISVGGIFQIHIGMERQFMKDGCRYLAIGAKSSANALPFNITVVREREGAPAPQTFQYTKSMNESTSK